MNIYEKLSEVQSKLKVNKDNFNAFGKYKYRSCEDILEGVKPLLKEAKAIVILTDDVEIIGDRFYVKATATFSDIEAPSCIPISVAAYAREDLDKKGMDLAQVTGSVSSYARKYALNGLFCIDDTKDSDATNKHGKEDEQPTASKAQGTQPPKPQQTNGEIPKCTKVQIAELFKLSAERKVPGFDFFKLLDKLVASKRISAKFTYEDKEKTKINWTAVDYEVIKSELLLPF